MKIRLTLIAWTLLLAAVVPCALAEVRVRANVDRTTVAPGESLVLRVTLEESDGEVDLSGLTDFKVLSKGSNSNFQLINGKMSRKYTYNYILIPTREGRLTIPALAVEVEGRRLLTDPITISMTAHSAEGGPTVERDVWVTAQVSNSTPIAGQQITYTFRFFRAVQTDNARFQPPDFQGFSAKEVEDRHAYRKTVNGREFAVTEVYFVLTPIEAGAQTIEPAMLQVGVLDRKNGRGRSSFDDIFGRRLFKPRVLQTEAVELQVKPLPEWRGEPPFSGLVGRFNLSAAMESVDLKVGDSATLTLTLQGQGNLMDARTPELQLPDTVKQYSDNPEEDIRLDATGYSGKKLFRTALVPVAAGEIQIAPIRLVYFDTEEKRYRTLMAGVPHLSVAPADETAETQVAVSPNPLTLAKRRVAFTGRDILPPKESLTSVRSRAPLPGWLFILATVAPAMAYGAAVLTQRFRHQEKTPAAIMKARAWRALKQAEGQTGKARLGHLYQALTAAILAAAGRTGEALTWKEAEALLIQQGFPRERSHQVATLLAKIESSKFGDTRIDAAAKAKLLNQTRKTIRTLI